MDFFKIKWIERAFSLLFFLSFLGLVLSDCGKDPTPPVTVNIIPNFFKLPPGGEVQLTAQVGGTGNQAVTWKLTGLSKGSVSSSGLYKAPLFLNPTDPPTATIQAISQADPNASGNGAVSITSFSSLVGETVAADANGLAVGGYAVRAGQTIDLNGDNVLDLVTTSLSNGATVFLGLGNGLFLKKVDIPINQPVALAVADFINDPSFVSDVAVASAGDRAIQIISGNAGSPQAAFPNKIAMTLDLQGKVPSALAAGGFHGDPNNGDRRSDLAVGTEDGAVLLLLQNKDGTFTMGASFPVGARPIQLVTADFNQDTFLDLAVVRQGMSDILIFLGDGQGNLTGPKTASFSSPPTALAIGDFNNDKTPDLAAAHNASNQVSISLGKGDGTFQPAAYTAVGSAPGSITAGDFNLAGNADIAVTLPALNAVSLLFADETGRLIGDFRYDAGAPPLFLVSGFFTGFQTPQGFQSVGLIYINPTDNKFYLLNNTSS